METSAEPTAADDTVTESAATAAAAAEEEALWALLQQRMQEQNEGQQQEQGEHDDDALAQLQPPASPHSQRPVPPPRPVSSAASPMASPRARLRRTEASGTGAAAAAASTSVSASAGGAATSAALGESLPPTVRLGRDVDAQIRAHEAHMAALAPAHVRRRIETAALAEDPEAAAAVLSPVAASATRALLAVLPQHTLLAAARGLYPRPLAATMERTSLGLVDTLERALQGARNARETHLTQRIGRDRRQACSAPSGARASANDPAAEIVATASIRDHPYFASPAQSPAGCTGDPSSEGSSTPEGAHVDALLSSSFFSSHYTHRFEDESLPRGQRIALEKCRQMERYSRDLARQVRRARARGLALDQATPSPVSPAHGPRRDRHGRAYRFNDERSDESDEDRGHKLLRGIRREVEEQKQAAARGVDAVLVTAFVTAESTTAAAVTSGRPSSFSSASSARRQAALAPTAATAAAGAAVSIRPSTTPLTGAVGAVRLPRSLARAIATPQRPAVLRELAKLRAHAIKHDPAHLVHQVAAIVAADDAAAAVPHALAAATVAADGRAVLREEEKEIHGEGPSLAPPETDASPPSPSPSPRVRARPGPTPENLASLALLAAAARPASSPGNTAGLESAPSRRGNTSLSQWMSQRNKLRKTVLEPEQVARCADMFALLDSNSDGVIQLDEMARALERLGIRADLHRLKDSLRDFNPGADGIISFEEFLHGFSSIATWDTHLAHIFSERSLLHQRERLLRREAALWSAVEVRERGARRAAAEKKAREDAATEGLRAAAAEKQARRDARARAKAEARARAEFEASAPPLLSDHLSSARALYHCASASASSSKDASEATTATTHAHGASRLSLGASPTAASLHISFAAPPSPRQLDGSSPFSSAAPSPRSATAVSAAANVPAPGVAPQIDGAPSAQPTAPSAAGVPPLPAVGAAAGLALEERQAIARLRARTASRNAEAEARFMAQMRRRASEAAADPSPNVKEEKAYERALARLKAHSPRRALPADVAASLGLPALKPRAPATARTAKKGAATSQGADTDATNNEPKAPTSTSAPASARSHRPLAVGGGQASVEVPFFLWTAAFQRHSKLSNMIDAHVAEQQADQRAQAAEIAAHAAEVEALFAAAEAQGAGPVFQLQSTDSAAAAKRRESALFLQSLAQRTVPMPLLNYDANSAELRVRGEQTSSSQSRGASPLPPGVSGAAAPVPAVRSATAPVAPTTPAASAPTGMGFRHKYSVAGAAPASPRRIGFVASLHSHPVSAKQVAKKSTGGAAPVTKFATASPASPAVPKREQRRPHQGITVESPRPAGSGSGGVHDCSPHARAPSRNHSHNHNSQNHRPRTPGTPKFASSLFWLDSLQSKQSSTTAETARREAAAAARRAAEGGLALVQLSKVPLSATATDDDVALLVQQAREAEMIDTAGVSASSAHA